MGCLLRSRSNGETPRVQVFYSPSCPFSFREIERVREVLAAFGDRVSYEEVNLYERREDAEKAGFYALLWKDMVSLFIDGERYKGPFDRETLGNALRNALEDERR